jgi:large repetitive protein
VERLGGLLDSFAQFLGDVVRHGFTFSLATNVVTALPGVPARYPIILENKGTETTTFDFNIVSSLPFGMTGSFTQSSVTLQPGERLDGGPSGVFLLLDFTGGALFPEPFKISATPQEAPGLSRQAQGSVAVRAEFVQVAVVTPTPAFSNPGGSVAVTARILNSVNREQAVRLSYTVTNSGGSVVFTSPTVPFTLGLQSTLLNVNLPAFDTTGLALGAYSILVTVTDVNGSPIPGGTGTASLLIGTPVSGTITVDPATLLAGNGTVTNTLSLTVQTPPANPLTLAGQVQTTPTATTLITVGNYAYVAGTNGIDIVDVSNPSTPTVVTTFGQGQILQGGFTVVRAMTGNRIIIATRGVLNASTFDLLTYSIANPTSPTLLGKSTIAESFISDLFVVGDRAIATTYGITFIAGNVIEQFGDVIALDLTNPAAVSVTDELFGNAADNFNQSGGELVNATTLYVASTTSTGGFTSTQSGVGLLRVIDISNPANLTEVRTLSIPNTKHIVEIVIDGNRALLVGSTGGWKSPFTGPGDSQLTGNMTLTLLDITDPLNPLILNSTLITESVNRPVETADGGAKQSTLALGNGLFAVSRGFVNGQPVLLLVDTNDSAGRLAVAAIQVPSLVNELAFVNNQLYTTSAAGLLIYDLAAPVFTTVMGSVRVPNSTENRVLTGSFNTLPTTVIPGATFDTLVWDRLVGFGMSNLSFTWQTELADLTVGESADVTLGTTVDFVSQSTPGSFELPATLVAAPNVLAFSPSTQTVSAGNEATYTITLSNPSTRGITYTLSLQGIPETWVTVDRFVVIGPQSSVQVTLRLKPEVFSVGNFSFVLFASGGGRVLGTAQGDLTVVPNNSTVDPNAHGVFATLLPESTMAGPAGVASYTVRLTNTGSITETFNLSAVLPPQLTGSFAQTNINVPPGISNFRDVSFEISPEVGTAPGALAFTITATSTSSVSTSTANGTLTVAPLGVDLAWDASTGVPGRDFQLTVTNTGQTAETFNLAVAGPSGVVAKLGTNTVTLAPGSSQLVSVATTNLSFATPGEWNLIATATSTTQPGVNSRALLGLTVNPTAAIKAEFDQTSYTVTTPTGRDYTLRIDNLGNIEDAFSVTISGMTGQGNVYLIDPSGRPTSTISPLRLPAYGSGAVTVHADIATAGILAFTVEVRSLAVTTNVVTRNATLELSSTVPPPPVIPQLPIVPTVPSIPTIVTDIPTLPPPATSRPASPFQVSGRIDGTSTIYVPREGIYSPHSTIEYFAGFMGEVRVATGDVTGDGISDYVGGAGRGGGPRVAVIDGATGLRVGDFFAFEASFRGGIFVAIGDVDGDGRGDVIVTPDLGGGPVVAVYSGRMLTQGMSSESALLNRFFAAEDRGFRSGLLAAAGDLDNDGKADLIVSASFPEGPRIAIFNGEDVMVGLSNPERLTSDFVAFEDSYRNGSFIATGDVNGDGNADLAFGGGPGGGPRVRLIDGAELLARKDLRSLDQASEQNPALQLANFYIGNVGSRGGVRLAMLDIDGDGLSDIVSGSGDLEEGQVRLFLAPTIRGDSSSFQDIDPMLGENLPNGVFVG